MIDNMDNMIRADIALANNTFSSEFKTLKDIQIELNKKKCSTKKTSQGRKQ